MKWPSLIAKKNPGKLCIYKGKKFGRIGSRLLTQPLFLEVFYFLNIFSLGANPTKFFFYSLTFYLSIFLLLSLTVSQWINICQIFVFIVWCKTSFKSSSEICYFRNLLLLQDNDVEEVEDEGGPEQLEDDNDDVQLRCSEESCPSD